jgi:hypothetical protein
MPNVDAAFGLLPVGVLGGGTPQRNSAYRIASGYGSNIFTGSLVKSTGTTKQIALAAPGDRAVGVFIGCEYVDANGDTRFSPYWPASTTLKTGTECIAYVVDDPLAVFEVQASLGFALADIGAVADVTAEAGVTRTGKSTMKLDSATISATGSAQLKILDLVRRPDNEIGNYARALVMINEHELRGAMTAV